MALAIKSNIKYIAIGLLAYFFFLFANMPAEFAYGQWKKHFGRTVPINLHDINGTVWHGYAGSSMVNGQQVLGLTWNVNLFTLLLGIMETDFELKVKDGYTKGTMGHSFFGGTYLNNVEGWLPLSEIKEMINVSAFNPGGALDIKLANLKIDDHALVSARGDIAWHNAEMTFLKKFVLGGVNITLEPDGDNVKATLGDQGGPLRAEGTLVISPDKSFELNAAFGVRGSQPDLSNALGTLGRVDKDGRIKVSQKGNLATLGF